ncbi:MAG TPA: hypothetical protein DIW24_05940 [Bacteroidetes bacterium]|nr:hypothetical protein [Bacteroidota bacterium]HRR09459.1 hypothetical protein [Rhodothermales bacterium]
MRIFIQGVLLCLTFAFSLRAQSDGLHQIQDELTQFLLRQQTRGFLPEAFLNHQPISVYDARKALVEIEKHKQKLSQTDQSLLDFYLHKKQDPTANWAQKKISFLYKNKHDFVSTIGDGYDVQLNPIAYIGAGPGLFEEAGKDNSQKTVWRRTLGIRASGHIGKGVFFETRISGNVEQAPYPDTDGHPPRHARSLHYQAFGGRTDNYDYFDATGIVGYHSKHFEVRFGRDNNRWADGMNSVLLSNYPAKYDQLQLRTTLGKRAQYVNLFAAFDDYYRPKLANGMIPRRFAAFHELTLRIAERLDVSVFESIVFSRPSETGKELYNFELTYLNPIIFYRSVERDRGSPDNALVGAQASWQTRKNIRLYGQIILDEFTFEEIKAQNGYWANKYAGLLGFHWAGRQKTDVRIEAGSARPFLYSHFNPSTAYIHGNDVLGLQSGPNSRTFMASLHHLINDRWYGNLTLTYTQQGRNSANKNDGADPNITYDSTPTLPRSTYGNNMLQGIRVNTLLMESRISWRVFNTVFLDAGVIFQKEEDAVLGNKQFLLPFLQYRIGLPYTFSRY